MRNNEGEVLVCLAFQGDTQKQFYNLPFPCGLEKLL